MKMVNLVYNAISYQDLCNKKEQVFVYRRNVQRVTGTGATMIKSQSHAKTALMDA